MNFILDCQTWRCGRDYGGNFQMGIGRTTLLNDEGFSCCVGQFMQQCGVPRENLLNVSAACGVVSSEEKNIFRKGTEDILLSARLYGINDDSNATTRFSVKEKIDKIRNLLIQEGHTLVVINEEYIPDLQFKEGTYAVT